MNDPVSVFPPEGHNYRTDPGPTDPPLPAGCTELEAVAEFIAHEMRRRMAGGVAAYPLEHAKAYAAMAERARIAYWMRLIPPKGDT